ncbi:NAD(P)/FAD-dependent oxidoreductase [Rhodococcus sp. NPDC127530]|uniref:NAD(P)/FAD-dependent oxidoreductase n=1 Tax=unclassified Rhodococcus (in: high G+C Gram-positive bacteria) TaxID=192944 RepID=UPI00362772F6
MNTHPERVVIVGAGQAGFQTALSLREHKFEGPITIVGDENCLPYQRPPLSKAYLTGSAGPEVLPLRPESFYQRHGIDMRFGDPVTAIDRPHSRVVLGSGTHVDYGHLVLALGARPRRIPIPGADLAGVASLHTREDADLIRAMMSPHARIVVVGGGFIGMEVAAAAAAAGHQVTIIVAADRVMDRAVAPQISEYIAAAHTSRGTTVMLGMSVACIHGRDGKVTGVELVTGEVIPADLVVTGIGVLPTTDLAAEAGLAVSNGIVVDEQLISSDPRISAIGDCARYPTVHAPGTVRLESVQNASDHARHVAARITGAPAAGYSAVPWFWTHQFEMHIQIAGLGSPADQFMLHGDTATRRFSILRFRAGTLACVESVNNPSDHLAARKILGGTRPLTPNHAAEPEFSLKQFVAQAAAPLSA